MRVWPVSAILTKRESLEMRACNDAANLVMGPGNDAARLLTPSVSQDPRKCLLLRSQQARLSNFR
jgi:hypothetical protein